MVSSQDLQWYASNCNAVIEERGMKLSDTYLFQIDLLAVPVDSLSLPSFPFIFPLCHFFHGFFDAFFFPFIVGLRILNYLSIQHTAFSIHLCFSISFFTAFHTSSLPGLHWKQLSFLFFFVSSMGLRPPLLITPSTITHVLALLLVSSMGLCPHPLTWWQGLTDPSHLSWPLSPCFVSSRGPVSYSFLPSAHALRAFVFL